MAATDEFVIGELVLEIDEEFVVKTEFAVIEDDTTVVVTEDVKDETVCTQGAPNEGVRDSSWWKLGCDWLISVNTVSDWLLTG